MPIGRNRRRVLDVNVETKGLITIHPSFLLHVEEKDKEREYAAFVRDLSLARPLASRSAA